MFHDLSKYPVCPQRQTQEGDKTVDIFEQLRWLMKGAAEIEITKGIINAAEKLDQDFMESLGASAVLIERFRRELMRLASEYGGESKAQQLKQMMEDAMGL